MFCPADETWIFLKSTLRLRSAPLSAEAGLIKKTLADLLAGVALYHMRSVP
jgi:hypothetical protein